jgi:Ras homolog gene family, member Q
MSLPETDVFVVCYSVVNPTSFKNVKTNWISEIKKNCPNAPVILVGTKTDLREDKSVLKSLEENGESVIDELMGLTLQKEIGAEYFVECSAMTQKNVKECFHFAIESVLEPKKKITEKKTGIFSSISKSSDVDNDIDSFIKKNK